MECYVVLERIAYEGDEICGIDFTYDGAKALYDKKCEESPYTHIIMIQYPVGELQSVFNCHAIFDRPAAPYKLNK